MRKPCNTYKISLRPVTEIVPVTPTSKPNFVLLHGDDFTYQLESVELYSATYINTALAGFTSAVIMANPLNRLLLESEVLFNVNGTFVYYTNTQYDHNAIFVLYLNW